MSYITTYSAPVNGSSFEFASFKAIAPFCPTRTGLCIVISTQVYAIGTEFSLRWVREHACSDLYSGLFGLAIPGVRRANH